MLTIFTSARPFTDPHISRIQKNAIKSWTKIRPACEVILVGDDAGAGKVAQELGIIHIPQVKKNSSGKPLRNSVFEEAIKRASNAWVCFANADIILTSDLVRAVGRISLPFFFMAGRRRDLDVQEEINFNDPGWEKSLRTRALREGALHGPAALDYAVWRKDLDLRIPPLSINRGGWDNWIIYRMKELRVPVIDSTGVVTSIHQNHGGHIIRNLWRKDPHARAELKLAGGFSSMLTLREADYVLTEAGIQRPAFPRNVLAKLSFYKAWRLLLACRRWLGQI